ncbi:uncharacterized protein KIAA1143 homolog [Synchiropus picturatus]
MNKGKVSGVSWVKPEEPSFLKKFKNDVGYKEGPNVDTKRQEMPTLDDDSGSDREDELPQVVVLKEGDLTTEEANQLKEKLHPSSAKDQEESQADGKILFKKPTKRSSSDKFQGITASSSKKKKDAGEKEEKEKEKEKGASSGKKVKNNSLLSFGGDEEEED